MGGKEHVSETCARLLALYLKPDGSEWGGQGLENATGGAVARSYVANLKAGRIENPGLAKLEAISKAMGFPPALWFGDVGEEARTPDEALLAALKDDDTVRSLLEEALRLRLSFGRAAAAQDSAPGIPTSRGPVSSPAAPPGGRFLRRQTDD